MTVLFDQNTFIVITLGLTESMLIMEHLLGKGQWLRREFLSPDIYVDIKIRLVNNVTAPTTYHAQSKSKYISTFVWKKGLLKSMGLIVSRIRVLSPSMSINSQHKKQKSNLSIDSSASY